MKMNRRKIRRRRRRRRRRRKKRKADIEHLTETHSKEFWCAEVTPPS